MKLFDSELKVMEVLWTQGTMTAKELAEKLAMTVGWNKNTTYTVLKKLVEKGAVKRIDPGFHCEALIAREEVRKNAALELVEKFYGGSIQLLFASLLSEEKITEEQREELRNLIDKM